MEKDIVMLTEQDGTWAAFEDDWKAQCAAYGEDFDTYSEGTIEVLRGLAATPEDRAAVIAIKHGQRFVSVSQINVTPLPGYKGPVMRVRFMSLSPDFDFGDKSVDDYAEVLVSTFAAILAFSMDTGWSNARHIKFHLRSPADRQFFASLGSALNQSEAFESVQMRGAWLYVSKLEDTDEIVLAKN